MFDTAQKAAQAAYAQQALATSDYATPEAEALTVEIMQHTTRAQESANHALGRLWAIRDRVFTSNPANGANGAQGLEKAPQAFADAWRQSSNTLENTLAQVCSLANELANRL